MSAVAFCIVGGITVVRTLRTDMGTDEFAGADDKRIRARADRSMGALRPATATPTEDVVKVRIIGTSHEHQYVRSGKTTTASEEFRAVVKIEAVLQNARGIAEEMSVESLKIHGAMDSIPRQVANELGIAHLYADPDSNERTLLGLAVDEDSIRLPLWLSDKSSEEIEAAVAEDRAKREREWIRRVIQFDKSPLVFVCGRDHAHGFHEQLREAGFDATLYSPNWKPSRI